VIWTFLRRSAHAATACCAVLAFVCGSVPALAADSAPLNPPVKIKVNSPGLSGEGGLFLALDKGYFAAEGIQIDLIRAAAANSSTDTLAQLAGGDLDIGSLGMSAALLNAIGRGVGVVGLLPMNTISKGDRSSGLVVRQDHIESGRY
jgi:NitT/TauT family transport system substrate-binding protein